MSDSRIRDRLQRVCIGKTKFTAQSWNEPSFSLSDDGAFSSFLSFSSGKQFRVNCLFLSGNGVNKMRFVIHETTGKNESARTLKWESAQGLFQAEQRWDSGDLLTAWRFILPLFRSRRTLGRTLDFSFFSVIFPLQGGKLSLGFLWNSRQGVLYPSYPSFSREIKIFRAFPFHNGTQPEAGCLH